MHYVCSCIWGIPLSHHEGTDAYIQWQDNDRYALHSAAVMVTSFNGSRHKGLPEYAHRIRKVAQRCANQLVSPYSHVWAVCRVYGTRPRLPVRTTLQGRRNETKDRSHHFIACDCCITPIGGHLLSILEILKPHATLLFQIRARHPCDIDGGIVHSGTMAHAQGSYFSISQSRLNSVCIISIGQYMLNCIFLIILTVV